MYNYDSNHSILLEYFVMFCCFLATTPEEVNDFFSEIVYHAHAIQSKYKKFKNHRSKINSQPSHIHKSQIITVSYNYSCMCIIMAECTCESVLLFKVFLDEINTASCPGFLKQIIIDRTLSNKVCA